MRIASSLISFVLIALVTPPPGFADDADAELTERDFLEQSIQRIKTVQNRVDNYDDYVRSLKGMPSRNSQNGIGFDTGPTITTMDRGQRMSGAGSKANLERMQLELRTLKRKAGKTMDDLGDMRRETDQGEELDRDRIDSTIRRLERDADDIERDLRRM